MMRIYKARVPINYSFGDRPIFVFPKGSIVAIETDRGVFVLEIEEVGYPRLSELHDDDIVEVK